MTQEHALQNAIRLELAKLCTTFRSNVGQAWTGNKVVRLDDGSIVIKDPRPFITGLPNGFSDLFGFTPVEITPDMVGQILAIFTAIEVKTAKGRVTDDQKNFITQIKASGGFAGVARSQDEAVKIIRNGVDCIGR
jgi:hypothetical protein